MAELLKQFIKIQIITGKYTFDVKLILVLVAMGSKSSFVLYLFIAKYIYTKTSVFPCNPIHFT